MRVRDVVTFVINVSIVSMLYLALRSISASYPLPRVVCSEFTEISPDAQLSDKQACRGRLN